MSEQYIYKNKDGREVTLSRVCKPTSEFISDMKKLKEKLKIEREERLSNDSAYNKNNQKISF